MIGPDDPLQGAARNPHQPRRPSEFEGAAELWFDSLEAMAVNGARPDVHAPAAPCWKTTQVHRPAEVPV